MEYCIQENTKAIATQYHSLKNKHIYEQADLQHLETLYHLFFSMKSFSIPPSPQHIFM